MQLYKASIVAKVLDVPLQRLYQMARNKDFPASVVVHLGERQIRFNLDALEQWIQNGGSLSTQSGPDNGDAPTKRVRQ